LIEILDIPNVPPLAAAELLVAATLSWIGLNIHRKVRDPKTPPAEGVMLDLGLGFVAVTVAVLLLSASAIILF
jgi:hypothetical protein